MKQEQPGDIEYKNVDGVIIGRYLEGSVITLEVAKYVVEKRKQFTNSRVVPLLIDARNVKEVTREAREFFSSEEGYEQLSASAIMSDSFMPTSMANFLLKYNLKKTPIPIKLFRNIDDAVDWLKPFV